MKSGENVGKRGEKWRKVGKSEELFFAKWFFQDSDFCQNR